MYWRKLSRKLIWLVEQIETIIALLLGIVCSILGLIGIAPSFILASATLGILTLLAFSLLRDRSQRGELQRSLYQFVGNLNGPAIDDIFSKSADDATIAENAEQELWFVQETGTYSLETKKASIKSLLKRGGIVRFVVVNPKEEVLRRLALRNCDFSFEAIRSRTKLFHHYIHSLVVDLGADAEQLQVRYTPYIIDTACLFVDPNSQVKKKRKASISYLGFRISYEERLGIVLQGETSPKLFSQYYQQVYHLFQYASKIILLVGSPQSGKTAMIMKLVASLSMEERVSLFYMFCKAIRKGNKCIGYEVVTSTNPISRNYAVRRSDGNFELDDNVWASVTNELEQAYLAKKVLLVDEIGLVQSSHIAFSLLIEKILDDPSASMIATIGLDNNYDLAKKMKYHYRSSILKIDLQTKERNELEANLSHEIKSAVYINQFEI